MGRRRALLIGPFPPPIGGDTVLTFNVSRSRYWTEHGIELDCVDTSPGGQVRVPDERLTPWDFLRGARIFLQVAAKLPRCDTVLLWANSRFILTEGLIIVACCSMLRKPVFLKVFGAFLARRILRLPPPWKKLALVFLGKVDHILPETNALAQELVERCSIPAERVLALPNFLPDACFREPCAQKRFSGRCVFFGQVKREKGVFDIIGSVGGMADASCDFYGPVLDRDRDDFLEEVSQYPNLSYRGLVEPGKVQEVAMAYDVLLLPSFHEGEGIPAVILEAFAAGIPVIATKWLSLGEIVEDGVRGLLVPVRSPEKIREAIERLRADAPLYETMRRNVVDYVQSYSERNVLGELLVPRVAEAIP